MGVSYFELTRQWQSHGSLTMGHVHVHGSAMNLFMACPKYRILVGAVTTHANVINPP